jgi:hypothetical protein
MTEAEQFLEAIMVLPKKPEWVVFTTDPETIYEGLLKELNKLCGRDMRSYTGHDIHDDDAQFCFHISEWDLEEALGEQEYQDLVNKLPFTIDEYWEVTEYLAKKHFKVPTWVYLQGRHYDHNVVEVQIGVPKGL